MKKVIATLTGIFLALTLSACSIAELEELEKSLDELSAYSDECVNGIYLPPCFLKWEWHDSKLHPGYSPGRIWEYKVEARDGCPNGVRAEIAILDKKGYQIDYATEYTTAVPPGQKLILTFKTYNEDAYSSRMAEVNCR